jgi:hypothetical protein
VKDRNVTMQIWLGKQWLGQTDKAVQQTTGVTFGLDDSPTPDKPQSKELVQ